MTRIIALIVLTALAVGIALLLQRRRPDPPSAPSYRAPSQLDLDDFTDTAGRVLIALFASLTCETCPRAWAAIEEVAAGVADRVAVQRLDVQTDPDLHKRYRIDGVPTTVIADRDGVVVNAFFGPVTNEQLIDALIAGFGPDAESAPPSSPG